MTIRGAYVFLTVFAALAGCAGARPASPSGSPAVSPAASAIRLDPGTAAQIEQAAIASALQQVVAAKEDYRVAAADLLEVSVYREQDLSRAVRVSGNGSVTLPLIGSVRVGGMTVREMEAAVEEKLRDVLVQPQVTVFVKEYSNRRVFILGEVAKPGSYELPPEAPMTVVEAISLAGGFTPVAAKDRTRVIRKVEGRDRTYTIEVSAIMNRGQRERDIPLEPNDVIYVPQSLF